MASASRDVLSRVLHERFPQRANEQVLVQSRTLTVRDPSFRAAVQGVTQRLSALRTVQNVRSPLLAVNRGEISRDRHSVLIGFQITGSSTNADKRVGPSLNATAAAQRAHPNLRIEQAGDASSIKALNKSFGDDFAKARTLSLPITLLILVVAFGALVAAGIPVLLAATGVAATLGLIAIVSQLAAVDQVVSETVLLIGMAVGVDYSAVLHAPRARGTRCGAGRAGGAAGCRGNVGPLGSDLRLDGHGGDGGHVPGGQQDVRLDGHRHDHRGRGRRARLADGVAGAARDAWRPRDEGTRSAHRPAPRGRLRAPPVERGRRSRAPQASGLGPPVRGLVVALAIPAFGLHTSLPGLQGLPSGLGIVKTLNRIEHAFPGGPLPADVVIQSKDVNTPQVRGAINSLEREALATGQIHQPFKVAVNAGHDVAVVSMPLSGKGTDAASYRALDTLRRQVIPRRSGRWRASRPRSPARPPSQRTSTTR